MAFAQTLKKLLWFTVAAGRVRPQPLPLHSGLHRIRIFLLVEIFFVHI